MAKKIKMPPIDSAKVLRRLARAESEQLLISLRRWIPDADRIDGFVVGVGSTWVAVARLGDAVRLDGWCFIRVADIQSVSVEPDPDCFEVKALKAREEWPPQAPPVDLDGACALLRSASTVAPMLTVHVEFDRPDICWVGALTAVDESTATLREVSTRADWFAQARSIDVDDITRIDVGGGYEETLALVAGPPS